MSIEIMSKVWKSAPFSGGTLLVLLAISDHANDEGLAWPSINTIAKKARMSPRQARRCVKDLVESGWIKCLSMGGFCDGHNVSTRYRVIPPDKMSPGSLMTPHPLTSASPPPCHPCPPNHQKNHQSEPSLCPSPSAPVHGDFHLDRLSLAEEWTDLRPASVFRAVDVFERKWEAGDTINAPKAFIRGLAVRVDADADDGDIPY